MTPTEITANVKRRAKSLGFQLSGVCPAVRPAGSERLDQWLAAGYAGEMDYIAERRQAYDHPKHVLEGVRSIVMLGMHYRSAEPSKATAGQGRVSRYAWGSSDYHDVIRDRLHELADFLKEISPGAKTRGVVDTAPLLERDFAQLAGLGWVGKNTLVISPQEGSYFFLAALLTDAVLRYDAPHETDHCGTCTACLEACPTDAFPQPYVLDGSRCISYLTIELQQSIPQQLRSDMGQWLFGCDVCQDVCPWNRRAPATDVPEFQPLPGMNPVDLASLFDLEDDQFRKRFRKTPLWRSHRRGLLRNAAIVLGNQRAERCLGALEKGLRDVEPLVRGASAWAVGEVGTEEARRLLESANSTESDRLVREEIAAAIKQAEKRT